MLIDKEYRSMAVYLDTKEEVDRLLAKMTVTVANGSIYIFIRCYMSSIRVVLSLPPLRPFTPPLPSASPIAGQCALPGHSASTCTSMAFKCAPCGGMDGPKATDAGRLINR